MDMTQREYELRSTPGPVELRGGSRRIGGIGVVYGQRSRLLPGGFFEVVENRALERGAQAGFPGVVSRLEHHVEWLLATTDAKTMRLRNDPKVGVDYEVDLPDTTAGRDTFALVKRGDLKSASMGFKDYGSEWSRDGSVAVRHLVAIELSEISPVSQPAYVQTHTALRSLAVQLGEDPDDIFELARQDELRKLFPGRTDVQVAAPPTVPPTPLDVVTRRKDAASQGKSWAQAKLELLTTRPDDPIHPRRDVAEGLSPKQMLLELERRRIEWDKDLEPEQYRRWAAV